MTIRCDRRYLSTRAALQLGALSGVIAADLIFIRAYTVSVTCALLAVAVVVVWLVQRTWKFSLSFDQIRTQKLFTGQIDLRTEREHVAGIDCYEGILEAMLGVGTIRISTPSGHGAHAVIKWPHVAQADSVVAALKGVRNPA